MSTQRRRFRRKRRASKTAALMSDLYKNDRAQFYAQLNTRMVSWLDEMRLRAERLKDGGCRTNDNLSVFAVLENAEFALSSVRELDRAEVDKAMAQLTAESVRVVAAVLGPELYRLAARYHRKHLP